VGRGVIPRLGLSGLSWVLAVVGLVLALFLVLFLGGLCSAAWEIRQEKRAGKVPTRPAWERREHLRAAGGRFAFARGLLRGVRS
jgi:hypothetical protein